MDSTANVVLGLCAEVGSVMEIGTNGNDGNAGFVQVYEFMLVQLEIAI